MQQRGSRATSTATSRLFICVVHSTHHTQPAPRPDSYQRPLRLKVLGEGLGSKLQTPHSLTHFDLLLLFVCCVVVLLCCLAVFVLILAYVRELFRPRLSPACDPCLFEINTKKLSCTCINIQKKFGRIKICPLAMHTASFGITPWGSPCTLLTGLAWTTLDYHGAIYVSQHVRHCQVSMKTMKTR